ncbi:MAG: hypothetical protein C4326_12685 [Ignavibacteria bacterium]
MKRFVVLIFLFLYLYNFVGYLAVFSVLQYRIKKDVKHRLLSALPLSQLTQLSFSIHERQDRAHAMQWIENDEFRYEGKMYDVVRIVADDDSMHIFCVRDDQEEKVLADLDSHVRRNMGASSEQSSLDSFKDVFKESLVPRALITSMLDILTRVLPTNDGMSVLFTADVPSPPPRCFPPA